ncbi:MAG TPA: DUF996 domain-containing protein [Nitrososphaerales archaeon]|nr:DUF996 domain-containing protein [Nitrososphaerales archaeon]
MASLSQAKTIGAVGSILVLLTAVPTAGSLLGIIGFIMMLLAIRDIAQIVGDRSIFNNMLAAVGLAVVAIVVGALVVVGSVLRFVGLRALSLGPSFNASTVPKGDWIGLIGSILVGLAVVWVIMIVSAVYVRRTYTSMASKLGVANFDTAGTLYLVGAATTIILVGFVLLLVAQVMVIVAFFSIQESPPPLSGQPPQPTGVNRSMEAGT